MDKDQAILSILEKEDIYLEKGSLAKLRKFIEEPSEEVVMSVFRKLYLSGDVSIKNFWDARSGLSFIFRVVADHLQDKPELQDHKPKLIKHLKQFLKKN